MATRIASGTISNGVGTTISGANYGVEITGSPAEVINAGVIAGTANYGVELLAGGYVTNASGGTITGETSGVYVGNAPGTVVNAGSIGGNLTIGNGAGVFLQAGGAITNQLGGTITGYDGVKMAGTTGTVVNASVIAGNLTTVSSVYNGYTYNYNASLAAGVYLQSGGAITNQAGGTITGYDGVRASTLAATVVNAGVIAGAYASNYQNADGINLSAGGSVTNQAGGAIYGRNDGVLITGGRGTVVNVGTIHSHNGGYGGRGVSLDAGGVIINGTAGGTASSAMIAGYNYAIQFGATGTDTLVNYGTISGKPGTVAVSMLTGTVTNGPSGATGALIDSGGQASAVLISGVGTVNNYGTIFGHEYNGETSYVFGVSIGGSGTVASRITNLGTNALIAGYVAVYAARNATITNGGTLQATQQFGGAYPTTAVIFGGGTNRLIIKPGATFIGNVSGSGPVTVAPGGNAVILGTANGIGTTALELASAATAGSLSGLGTQFTGFASVTIDSGAQWTFAGSNTLAAGITLTDSGTLTDTGTFTNAGLVTGSAKGVILTVGAQVTNQSGGTIIGSSIGLSGSGSGTLVNAGWISGNQTVTTASGISFATGGSVTNQSGGTISGARAISGQAGTLSLLNAGSITGGTGAGRSGIALNGAGTISNQSGGVITGNYGIIAYAAGGTITNAGRISGVYAVLLNGAGRLTNAAGGTISGSSEGVLANALVTAVNAGSITGVGYGVQLAAGGTLTNQAGGTISSTGTAVSFAASRTNRLVIQPSAAFTGLVDGGNTIGAGSISTMELASSASVGTLSGLGSQFVHFAQVTIDAGAAWTLSGTQTGFATLSNAGSLGGASTYGVKVGGTASGITVINQIGGVITGSTDAVYFITGTGAGSVVNSGRITGGTTGFAAINLSGGGRVSNASGGTIAGHQAGVFIANGTGATVSNAGSIAGSQSYGIWLERAGVVTNAAGGHVTGGYTVAGAAGVYFGNGGSVTNQSGGTIGGYIGVLAYAIAVTVINTGAVTGNLTAGNAAGVYLHAGGSVTNQVGGKISGARGIVGYSGALTVVNAGTISGGSYAIHFATGQTNRLIVDQGAVFNGTVTGGTAADATLELASSSSVGTLSGFGTSFTNFGTLTFDAGTDWRVAGLASGFAATTITGFSDGDTIDLTNFAANSLSFSNNQLTLTSSGGAQDTLAVIGGFSTSQFHIVGDGASGTDITITICYLRGTRILTATGEVAVEDLRAGDMLVTRFGSLRPLKWIGRQSFAGRFLGKARAPVCFHAGSIADNVPCRELYVSPGHSVLIGGKLVIADLLVNGVTVTQTATSEQVDYFHLDLGQHDCVMADGAWAESYAAHNNRDQFHNVAAFAAEFPGQMENEVFQPLCLPRIEAGDAALPGIRALLLARVPDDCFTADGDVHLLADGVRIHAARRDARTWVFDVPANAGNVRLMSRASTPCSLGINNDDRMLGFCLSEVSVQDGITVLADDTAFNDGVHATESDGKSVWRWTTGDCRLPDGLFAGASPCRLTIVGRTVERYLASATRTARLAV